MKIAKLLIITLILTSLSTCLNSDKKVQVYPKNDFENINQIEINQYNSQSKKTLTDLAQIELFTNFLQDSTNYFKTDLIKFNGVKPIYFLNFITDKENLELVLYPSKKGGKIEVGFFSPIEDKKVQNAYREYHRFYVKLEIIDLIKRIED
ncbi:MAG: hypothetical protein QM478_03385 [Flavobacteriaceae bacterium]